MKVIRKADSSETRYNKAAITDYVHDGEVISSVININGRYPIQGYFSDDSSGRIMYVMKGSGKISTVSETQGLGAGDTVLLDAGESFFIKGQFAVYIIKTGAELSVSNA